MIDLVPCILKPMLSSYAHTSGCFGFITTLIHYEDMCLCNAFLFKWMASKVICKLITSLVTSNHHLFRYGMLFFPLKTTCQVIFGVMPHFKRMILTPLGNLDILMSFYLYFNIDACDPESQNQNDSLWRRCHRKDFSGNFDYLPPPITLHLTTSFSLKSHYY